MLPLNELHKILTDNNINVSEFTPQNICKIYGSNLNNEKVLSLLQEMVLAVIDFDTPLYDILAYADDFEKDLNLEEGTTFVCDILYIVISNMQVCKENADRLMDLIEDADILDAYNALTQDYKQFLSEKQINLLKELAKNTFDSAVLV